MSRARKVSSQDSGRGRRRRTPVSFLTYSAKASPSRTEYEAAPAETDGGSSSLPEALLQSVANARDEAIIKVRSALQKPGAAFLPVRSRGRQKSWRALLLVNVDVRIDRRAAPECERGHFSV